MKRASSPGMTFRRNSMQGSSFQVFADADYASKAGTRPSVSGEHCMFWFSRTQKCVTLSTTEPEHVASTDIIEEVLFFRSFGV